MDGITLQLVTENDPIAWFIRFATWSSVSHVDLVLPDGRLLGARFVGGVQIREPNYSNFTVVERYFYPCARPQDCINWAMAQVGKPYDWYAILNFFLHRSHNWRDLSAWFCSEAMNGMFDFTGQPILNADDCDHITPRDLTMALSGIKLGRNADGSWNPPGKAEGASA